MTAGSKYDAVSFSRFEDAGKGRKVWHSFGAAGVGDIPTEEQFNDAVIASVGSAVFWVSQTG